MIAHDDCYLAAKYLHVTCVTLSITGFVVRFMLTTHGSPLMMYRFARIAPHVNDTALLAAAVAMLVMTGTDPFQATWLRAKILGLLVYVLLGIVALRGARSAFGRNLAFAAAVLSFAYMVSVALLKTPWGALVLLTRSPGSSWPPLT
jgi:uncharacterized membrane protein SirB2